MYKERYLITGGTGFIGMQLLKQLLLDGHDIHVLTRNEVTAMQRFSQLVNDIKQKHPAQDLALGSVKTLGSLDSIPEDAAFDVVVNLAGQGIADKCWTNQVKQQLLDSRIQTSRALYEFLKDALVKPDVFISGSALGYYGLSHGDAPLDESAKGDDSFSSQLCLAWENEARRVEDLGIRTCYLRTGIVLGNTVEGKAGGALAKMLPTFRWGLGGPIGSGAQWMSWVHMDDLVGMIRYAIEEESISGPINATAPYPVTNKTFARELGKALKRPAILPMPAFLLRLMLGQMGEELLLSGQKVIPKKMLDAGYEFRFANLQDALQDILDR